MAATARVDTVRLQHLSRAFWESAAFLSAVELGLFTAIARGANTLPAVAAAVGVTPLHAERLVTVCVALGLVVQRDGRLSDAPDVERFLVAGEPDYAGAWMLFTKPEWDKWGRLSEFLRRTEPPTILGTHTLELTVDAARKYHEATFSVGMGAGRRFVRQVDLAKRTRILDLGGGSGCYCIAAAQAHPHLTAVVFDLPPVTVVTREFIAAHGLSDRIAVAAGDFTRDALPAGADVVIMASNLPMYSADLIQHVVSRAFAALLPGGEMHLIGEMLNTAGDGPIDPALWGLAEAIQGSTGRAHRVTECVGYLEQAGFLDVRAEDFVPGVLVRVSGRKAGSDSPAGACGRWTNCDPRG